MNIVLLPGSESSLKLRASTRRIGLCWEATRAPRWTRIPQAWAAQVAQAGLLRDRRQSEKSQGFGDGVPESFPDQTKTRTRGKSALAFSANRRFTLNQYISSNPGRRIVKSGFFEIVGYLMWFTDVFWNLAGVDKAAMYSVSECTITEEAPGLMRVQAGNKLFSSAEGEEARLQKRLREVLFGKR